MSNKSISRKKSPPFRPRIEIHSERLRRAPEAALIDQANRFLAISGVPSKIDIFFFI
jgi:hypothetical protein